MHDLSPESHDVQEVLYARSRDVAGRVSMVITGRAFHFLTTVKRQRGLVIPQKRC